MAPEQRQQQRLQGCKRSSAMGSEAVAQSNEIGLTVIRDTSREGEVETDNETQQARQRREKIVCYTILAAQLRPRRRAAGVYPLYPGVVLDRVGHARESTSVNERDDNLSGEVNLDTSLLDSSPPAGTELRQANALLTPNINGASDSTPRTKRYTGRMAWKFERLHTEMVTIVQERDAQRQLLEAHKERKTGKRVMLQNKFVFSTPEVLKITMEAESTSGKKKRREGVKDTR
jgi:hypothetical protein